MHQYIFRNSKGKLPNHKKRIILISISDFLRSKKTSLVIAILSLLVFILTLFCMKQQNDYAILMDGYYRQSNILNDIRQLPIIIPTEEQLDICKRLFDSIIDVKTSTLSQNKKKDADQLENKLDCFVSELYRI